MRMHFARYSLQVRNDKRDKYSDLQAADARNMRKIKPTKESIRALEESSVAEVISGYWTSYLVRNNVAIPYYISNNKVYRINGITIDNNNDSSWYVTAVAVAVAAFICR